MSHKRLIAPIEPARSDDLTAAMVGIGMAFAAPAPSHQPNIEDTLFAASVEGMEHDDLRVLAVLVTWLEHHARLVNVDRLTRLVKETASARVRAFWAGVAHWQAKDRRFARLSKLHRHDRVDLLPVGTEFQLRRHGEDVRFAGSPLRVPANTLRSRSADVLEPVALAQRHRAYRQRVLMGPSYRADMWAALDEDDGVTAAELARRAYGSFATAWQVLRDWRLVRDSGAVRRSR